MRWVWFILYLFFKCLEEKCAARFEAAKKRSENKRRKRIKVLVEKTTLTAKESQELNSLLSQENSVIVLE